MDSRREDVNGYGGWQVCQLAVSSIKVGLKLLH